MFGLTIVEMAFRSRIFVLLLGLAAACASPTEPTSVTPGQPFELRLGAKASLGAGVTITFVEVRSDSRCPMDAVCVWAGEAVISLAFDQPAPSSSALPGACTGSGNRAECTLSTTPNGSSVAHGAWTIRLVQLAPYPRATTPIRREDYVATLVVAAR